MPSHLARSTPPRIGAVLVDEDGLITYTDVAPPAEILEQFKDRRDNQIASLEMMAIAYGRDTAPAGMEQVLFSILLAGMSTFAADIRNRRVIVHSDNTVAEHSMRKGTTLRRPGHACSLLRMHSGRARAFDHTAIVHSVWYKPT